MFCAIRYNDVDNVGDVDDGGGRRDARKAHSPASQRHWLSCYDRRPGSAPVTGRTYLAGSKVAASPQQQQQQQPPHLGRDRRHVIDETSRRTDRRQLGTSCPINSPFTAAARR